MLHARQYPRPSSTWSASMRATAVGWPVRKTTRASTASRFAPLTVRKIHLTVETPEPFYRDVGERGRGAEDVSEPSWWRLRSYWSSRIPDALEAVDVG